MRYGGNTPCVEVRTGTGALVILDAGTGIRELGQSLVDGANGSPIAGDIFLTHAHWDHIQGIPFFAPIFERGNQFTIWGATALRANVGRVVRDQMSPVVFPVTFDSLLARVEFAELDRRPARRRRIHDRGVRATPPRRRAGVSGDRHRARRTLVRPRVGQRARAARAATATTPAGATGWSSSCAEPRRSVHDATYTPEEYDRHRGWGHSTYDDARRRWRSTAASRELVLFHHKPERHDDDLDARLAACRATVARRGMPLRVTASAEGMTLAV